jgi:hypothetical protein
LLVAFGIAGGICLALIVFAGVFSFVREGEQQLPTWFVSALADDREGLLRSDAFRSLIFITLAFLVLYFEVWKRLAPVAFYSFLIVIVMLDSAIVDSRYLSKDDYRRKRENTFFVPTEADQEILKDKSYYRVFNLDIQSIFLKRTSYFHNSVEATMLSNSDGTRTFMTHVYKETNELIQASGKLDFKIRRHQYAQRQIPCVWTRRDTYPE